MQNKKMFFFLFFGSIVFLAFKIYFNQPEHTSKYNQLNDPIVGSNDFSSKSKTPNNESPLAGSASSDVTYSIENSSAPSSLEKYENSSQVSAIRSVAAEKETGVSNAQLPSNRDSFKSTSAPAQIIPLKDAKGGVYALYRAVLWRDPDRDGGLNAMNLFSTIGWSTYIENSRNMISSPEFEERILPNHDTASIVRRIYSVFLGRCPTEAELEMDFERFENREPGQITEAVLRQASSSDIKQIFAGGYSPNLCAKKEDAI